MTYPPLPKTPPGPAKRHGRIVAAAFGVAAVLGVGIAIGSAGERASGAHAGATAPVSRHRPSLEAAVSPSENPYVGVDETDFDIELITKERQCFGSAGCNITVVPDITFLGTTQSIDPAAVYEITYEISGDESGPVIETAELTDQDSLSYSSSVISTASSAVKVTAEVTAVTLQEPPG